MGVLEETIEGEGVTAAKRSFVLQRNQIWAKEETFRSPHGQRAKMESEGEGLGMDLLRTKV